MSIKALHYSSYFVILIAGFMLFLFSFWNFYPYKPIEVNYVKVLQSEIPAGKYLTYQISFKKNTDKPCIVHRELVNGFSIFYTPVRSNLEEGTKRVLCSKLKVPTSAEPGEYRLRWEGVYNVNPVREVSVLVWSNYFNIVPGDGNND